MKKYKATWVGDNPFEGRQLKECFQVVEVDDDFPIGELETFAKAKTPSGYNFRDVVEVDINTPISELQCNI